MSLTYNRVLTMTIQQPERDHNLQFVAQITVYFNGARQKPFILADKVACFSVLHQTLHNATATNFASNKKDKAISTLIIAVMQEHNILDKICSSFITLNQVTNCNPLGEDMEDQIYHLCLGKPIELFQGASYVIIHFGIYKTLDMK